MEYYLTHMTEAGGLTVPHLSTSFHTIFEYMGLYFGNGITIIGFQILNGLCLIEHIQIAGQLTSPFRLIKRPSNIRRNK